MWLDHSVPSPSQPQTTLLTEHNLRIAWGLTPAETQLALRLATGRSLQAAARSLSITYESARSRLKSVFLKTGTHRQGELIAVLAGLNMRLEEQNAVRPHLRVGSSI